MRGPFRAGIAVLAGVAGLAVAAPAMAATNQPIAQTGGAIGTFNIAGVPLQVTVALDTTTGDITSVSVDPNGVPGATAGTTDPLTATVDSPTRVKFETADGTTKVSVKAKKNSLSMGVRTASLDQLVGSNSWTGDLFGKQKPTTVKYTIGKDAAGAPTFAFDGTVTPADGSTATVLGTWSGSGHDDDDEGMTAGGRMAFELDGFRKTLTVSVRVRHDDEGTGHASLSVTLQGRDIQRLPIDKLAGAKVWTGQLCEGTKATINYTVGADGSVKVDSTTPEATTNASRHGVLVKFATGDKVSIQVFSPSSGDASLKIDRRGRQCTGTRVTVPDPKVNTPVSTTAPSEKGSGKNHGGGRDHGGSGKGGDDGHGDG